MKTLDQVIKKLPAKRRAKISARAKTLIKETTLRQSTGSPIVAGKVY